MCVYICVYMYMCVYVYACTLVFVLLVYACAHACVRGSMVVCMQVLITVNL